MKAQLLALKNRSFRNFFFASFTSFFGSGMHLITATWFILEATQSSIAVAGMWFCQVAASLIILIYSGAIIDRLSRQKLLCLLSLIRGVIVLLVSISIYIGTFSLWQLYLLAFLNGAGFYISFPTEQAMVHELVEKENLIMANSLIEISIQTGVFISAGLSGIIYKFIGLGGVLVLDAFTFFVAAAIFRGLPKTPGHVLVPKGEGYLKTVKEGWSYLFREKKILLLAIIAFIPAAVTLSGNIIKPAYVKNIMGLGVISYGVLDMAYGIGAFFSGLLIVSFMKYGRVKIASTLILLSTSLLFMLPHNTLLWLAMAMFLMYGFCNSSLRIIFSTTMMEIVPKEYMGRISSAAMLSSVNFQLVSFILVGYFVDHLSVKAGYYYLSCLMLLTLIGYAVYQFSKLQIETSPKIN